MLVMSERKRKHHIDYTDKKIRTEILVRQRRELWSPEQVRSLAKLFRLRPGMKLLDCGCGLGYAMRTWGPFVMPGGKLTGLDPVPDLLRQARRNLGRDRLGKAAEFVQGDIRDMPLGDNSFDISIAHVVFCHLAGQQQALDEMIRVTRPGGCVAVFDNAVSGGPQGGWSNIHEPTIERELFELEMHLRSLEGLRRLGHGDFRVGCYVPSWMEARGLRDVNVRCNEKVRWVAPPYRSPAQQTDWSSTRERIKARVTRPRPERIYYKQLRAGGADEKSIRRMQNRNRRSFERLRKAAVGRTLAYAWSSQFWCIWGFCPTKGQRTKPRGRKT
jgi:ubiquinone/menaquinone biosynthesis C-methylase UbiE